MKAFSRNPVGMIVLAIVCLVLLASYMQYIIFAVAVAVLGAAGIFLAKRLLLGSNQSHGHFCTHCSHPSHGHQECRMCRCHG